MFSFRSGRETSYIVRTDTALDVHPMHAETHELPETRDGKALLLVESSPLLPLPSSPASLPMDRKRL
jgi:hypothetical protein